MNCLYTKKAQSVIIYANGVKDIMGGKVLELSSEKLIKKGRAEEKSVITNNIKNNLRKQHPDWDEARIEAETEMLIKAI